MQKFIIASVVIIFGFLTGCATEVIQKYPLLRSDAEKITSTDAVIIFDKGNVEVEVEFSNMAGMMGGGAIWAIGDIMVESKRKSAAQKEISPILAALNSSSLSQDVDSDLSTKLKGVDWLRVNEIQVINSEDDFDEDKIMTQKPDRDLLLIHITNKFPTSKRSVYTTGQVILRLKNIGSNQSGGKRDHIIMDKKFTSDQSLQDSILHGSDPVQFWSANSGEAIISSIRKNTMVISEEIIKSLNRPFASPM